MGYGRVGVSVRRQTVASMTTGCRTLPVPKRGGVWDSIFRCASSALRKGPCQLYPASCQYHPAGRGLSASRVAYHCDAQNLGFRCCDMVRSVLQNVSIARSRQIFSGVESAGYVRGARIAADARFASSIATSSLLAILILLACSTTW